MSLCERNSACALVECQTGKKVWQNRLLWPFMSLCHMIVFFEYEFFTKRLSPTITPLLVVLGEYEFYLRVLTDLIKFVSTIGHRCSVYYANNTNLKEDFREFLSISQDYTNVFDRFPKGSEDVSIVYQQFLVHWKMKRGSNVSGYDFTDICTCGILTVWRYDFFSVREIINKSVEI